MTRNMHTKSPSSGSASSGHQSAIESFDKDTRKSQDMQTQLEQSMQRSVTLVFWHTRNCDPIRLHHTVSTFPYFQLSSFSSLASDLGLSPTSYVDSYNPQTGRWEQCMITSVRTVETEQRLLYRARKSLLEGLSEDECLDLKEELDMQPKHRQPNHTQAPPGSAGNTAIKRAAQDAPEPQPANKYYIVDGRKHPGFVAFVPPTNLSCAQSFSVPNGSHPPSSTVSDSPCPSTSSSSPSSSISNKKTQTYVHVMPPKDRTSPTPQGPAAPIPYHPHPPLKRWPNDYTVSEIALGFQMMDALVAQTPTVVQRTAFERVFGCRYVKSTVCRHRSVWRKADPDLIERFVAMGAVQAAVWGEFVRQVEGRPAGKIRQSQGQSQLIKSGSVPAEMLHNDLVGSIDRSTPQMFARLQEEEEEMVTEPLDPPLDQHEPPGSAAPASTSDIQNDQQVSMLDSAIPTNRKTSQTATLN